MLLRK